MATAIRGAIILAALLAAANSQQQQQQQQQPQYSADPSSGQTAPLGFMPMNEDRRTPVVLAPSAAPETSSVQSRDYSGSSDFYGYNNYPPSYGPPSSSYGSSGESSARPYRMCRVPERRGRSTGEEFIHRYLFFSEKPTYYSHFYSYCLP